MDMSEIRSAEPRPSFRHSVHWSPDKKKDSVKPKNVLLRGFLSPRAPKSSTPKKVEPEKAPEPCSPLMRPEFRPIKVANPLTKENSTRPSYATLKSLFSRIPQPESSQSTERPQESGSIVEPKGIHRSKSAILPTGGSETASPRSSQYISPNSTAFRSRFQVARSEKPTEKPSVANLPATMSLDKGTALYSRDEAVSSIHAQYGDMAFANRDFDSAVVEYSRAIERRPMDAELMLRRASAHYKLECYNEALADATRARKLNPRSPRPYYQLGLIYKHLGDYPSAVQSIRTALELEVNPPPSLVALTLNAESVLKEKRDMTEVMEEVQPLVRPRMKPEFINRLQIVIPASDEELSALKSPSSD